MKQFRNTILILSIFTFGAMITACTGGPKSEANSEQVSKQGKEYTSAYICPMHCKGSGSDTAGKCPACGMDYVANENNNSHDHHDHDHHDHEGHNHDH